jgi:hypothetical protein
VLRPAVFGLLLTLTQALPAADEIEPLDADFLEYLANMEREDDDWTLLADAEDRQRTSTDKAAAEAQAAKKAKEAASPAADER